MDILRLITPLPAMWRQVVNMVVVPLFFAAVAAVAALITVDMARSVQQNISTCDVEPAWQISPYDDMFQTMGKRYGIDWLLLSAIASVESKFTPDAVSKVGAIGLMQVMPAVAISMDYTREQLFDAEISAEVAAKLLHENNNMLRLRNGFDKEERLNFILACYNAGYSRIADARRLARYHDEDANQWSIVQNYLALLAEPEYVEHEAVQSGPFYGSAETIAYVRKVMRVYGRYKKMIEKQYD